MSRNQEEFRLACFVADCLRYGARPGVEWTHFPAGEHRNEVTGARLKRMGLKKGWPDYLFDFPDGRYAYLELKTRSGRLTPEQQAFRTGALARGRLYAVARTGQEAIEILSAWGILERVKVAA